MATRQEEEFYSLIELYDPNDPANPTRYQTWCEGFVKEYKRREYSEYLCINFPVSPTKQDINLDMKVTLPNISARDGSSFTRDWLMSNNELRGWMVRIAWFRNSDPNWVVDFVPWLVTSSTIEQASVEIRLSVPLKLVSQAGKLVSKFYNDQDFPHLVRVYN